MNTLLKGWRTIIVGVLLVLYAVCQVAGIPVPDANGEVVAAISGLLMIALRRVTTGPVGGA